MTVMLLLGVAMLLLGGLGLAGSRLAALALVACSAAWIYFDMRPEGPILWSITPEHGVVLADLWGLLGGIVGVVLLVRVPSRTRRG